MIEFVKGQWYQNNTTKEYYQCIDTAHNVLLACRRAGQDTHIIRYGCADDYTTASLIPDFSNAKVGDECFSPMLSNCLISDINGEWEMYDDGERFEVSEVSAKQKHSDNYTYYYPPTRNTHPLLFNSFAQFQAYWAEQALLMATQRRNHE